MEKGAKIALGIVGISVAVGVGFAIYYATRPSINNTVGNNTGGGANPAGNTGGGGIKVGGFNVTVKDLQDAGNSIKNAVQEKFPFRVGMVGPNIKSMQDALRNKFNELTVKSDGVFGPKTFAALKRQGYVTLVNNTIDDTEFLDIIDGVKKTSTPILSANGNLQQGDKVDFWYSKVPSANYPVI